MGTLFTYSAEDAPVLPVLTVGQIARLTFDKALACAWAEHNAQRAAQEMAAMHRRDERYSWALQAYEGYSREAALLWPQLQRICAETPLVELMIWAYLEVEKETAAAAEDVAEGAGEE